VHVPVDTAALVPPAFKFLGVYIYRKYIFLVTVRQVADVQFKGVLGTVVVVQQAAVEIDGRIACNAIKAQQNPFVLTAFG
jgi:hypothetical protein